MKNAETYFKKNGFIWGLSTKYGFGWEGYCIRFDDFEKALQWLETEEYDFRERELCSKTTAMKWQKKYIGG